MKTIKFSVFLGIMSILVATQLTMAAPSSPPPSPNLPDATFNYVTANNGAQVTANNSTWSLSTTNNDTTSVAAFKGAIQATTAHPDGAGLYAQNISGVGGYGVLGSAPAGVGIFGLSSTGNGVYGRSSASTGVAGSSDSGIGAQGLSISGVGVWSFSNSGIGLQSMVGEDSPMAGSFLNSPAGITVDIGTDAYAINASGKPSQFSNGSNIVQLANSAYGITTTRSIYAMSTATGGAATITAFLSSLYNGNAINAYTYNPNSRTIYAYNGGGNYAIHAYSNSPATAVVYVDGGATSIYTTGNNKQPGGGSWLATSDIRLKDVHSKFDKGLKELLSLEPIKYNYKKDNPEDLPSDKEYVGLSAQEVQTVIPEAVSTDNKGYLQISNDPIIWTMLNAIKELAGKDEALKQENNELKSRVASLEERLAKLEATVH